MYQIELIKIKGGFWSAHCEEKQIGSLSENRAEALKALMDKLAENKGIDSPQHKHEKNSLFKLKKGGYSENPKLMKYFGNS